MYFYKIISLGAQNKSLIDKNEIKDLNFILLSNLNKKNMDNFHLKIMSLIEMG